MDDDNPMWYVERLKILTMRDILIFCILQFTCVILTEFKICFGVHTGFNHTAVELPNFALRQNIYGPHESNIQSRGRFQYY